MRQSKCRGEEHDAGIVATGHQLRTWRAKLLESGWFACCRNQRGLIGRQRTIGRNIETVVSHSWTALLGHLLLFIRRSPELVHLLGTPHGMLLQIEPFMGCFIFVA